jgi:hypothetical protein
MGPSARLDSAGADGPGPRRAAGLFQPFGCSRRISSRPPHSPSCIRSRGRCAVPRCRSCRRRGYFFTRTHTPTSHPVAHRPYPRPNLPPLVTDGAIHPARLAEFGSFLPYHVRRAVVAVLPRGSSPFVAYGVRSEQSGKYSTPPFSFVRVHPFG